MKNIEDVVIEEGSPIEALFTHYQEDDDMLNQLKEKDFSVATDNRSQRATVGAYTMPTGQKDKDCFIIRQLRFPDIGNKAFIMSKLSAEIHSPGLGAFAYNHDKLIEGDQWFLADRDGKIADPYIYPVEEFLSEIYRALGTRNASAFTRLF